MWITPGYLKVSISSKSKINRKNGLIKAIFGRTSNYYLKKSKKVNLILAKIF